MSPDSVTLADAATINPDVIFKELSGEGVLLDLASGIYFGLDETSTRLWLLMAEHRSLQTVFDLMLEEFDVDPDRLREDLLAFVSDLSRRHLITTTPHATR